MTLIACSHLNSAPTLLGDLLISDEVKRPFKIPVAPEYDISSVLKGLDGLWPKGYLQKLYIVSPTITLGFAGYVYEMKSFYFEFKIFCGYYGGKLTDKILRGFLDRYDWKTFTRSSCLILNVSENEQHVPIGNRYVVGNWKAGFTESLQDLFVVGSGSKMFLDQVMSETLQMDNFNPLDPNNAIIQNVSMAAEFLGWERKNLSTIRNLWGGGYEIVTYVEGAFQKMDDIAYVISEAKYDPQGSNEIPSPLVIVHVKYHGNLLVITSIPVEDPVITTTDSHVIVTCTKHHMEYFPVGNFDSLPGESPDPSLFNKSFVTNNVAISYILTRDKLSSVNQIAFEYGGPVSVEFDYKKEVRIRMSKERQQMLRYYNLKRDSLVSGNSLK